MADENFEKILEELGRIHTLFPDLRFGEVVQSALDKKRMKVNSNFFDTSSKQLLSALEDFKDSTEKRRKKNVNKNKSK